MSDPLSETIPPPALVDLAVAALALLAPGDTLEIHCSLNGCPAAVLFRPGAPDVDLLAR